MKNQLKAKIRVDEGAFFFDEPKKNVTVSNTYDFQEPAQNE